jgi:lantibiotic transport system permease protein
MAKYMICLQCEWLKSKRSLAAWLSLIGGFFIPLIYFIVFLSKSYSIFSYPDTPWETYFYQQCDIMCSFLLPMGVIMASSLITQLEYKNNTWKQLHTTPQPLTAIFIAKLSVILLMTIQFFIFFNIGILLSGAIPCLIFESKLPSEQFPLLFFLKQNTKFFISCLPIIALQYLISLKFKNFLIPVGIGLLALIGTMIGLNWKHIYLSPFSYGSMIMRQRELPFNTNVYFLALIYFILITAICYFLYIKKKEKG